MFLKNYFFSELSRMCFTVQLSRFLSVFDSSDILSYRFALVKNFFIFLDCHSFATALLFYHVLSCLSSTFFIFLCDVFLHRSELPYNSTPSSIRQPLFLHFFLFLLYRPLTNISGCRQDSGCSAPVPVFL